MVNVNESSAIGASIFAGAFIMENFRWGIKGHYRRWLGESSSFDLSTGILLAVSHSDKFGFTGQASFVYRDHVSVFVQWDRVESRDYQADGYARTWHNELYGGIKLGSKPALYGVATEGGALLLLLIYVALSGDGFFCIDCNT